MATIVMGLFDTQQEAANAREALKASGIPATEMSMTQHDGSEAATEGSSDETWGDRLKRMFGSAVHHEDVPYYHEGLRRGGTLLTVRSDERREQEVAGIFADHNAVDIDTRAVEWKSAGWKPDESIAIPVVEEQLAIGKRTIRRGGVRVYTSVTETPVEEAVTLREEHVEVTRRPADRAATASDLISENPIELTETAEEPVVSKQAKVVEEVVVNKTATERTEHIKDTVRRKDVDVKEAS
ncbi:YsnF/AvaK domain-containing protein [Nitrospira sp. Nam74]